MAFVPLMLNVSDRRCLIVGGGFVARRRAAKLSKAGAIVTVVAPDIEPGLASMSAITCHHRPFEPADAADADFVVVATDEPDVNEAVARAARAAGAWVNRADRSEAGDMVVPVSRNRGPMTVAVSTNGSSAELARTICEQMIQSVSADEIRLLQLAGDMRAKAQSMQLHRDVRKRLLHAIVEPRALALLADAGEAALTAWYDQLLQWARTAGPETMSDLPWPTR